MNSNTQVQCTFIVKNTDLNPEIILKKMSEKLATQSKATASVLEIVKDIIRETRRYKSTIQSTLWVCNIEERAAESRRRRIKYRSQCTIFL